MTQYTQIGRHHLYETVAQEIERMILDETLKIGEKLPPEKIIAEKFGVSRNILREALKTLKERGLVEVKTGDGVYVAKPEMDILKDMVNRLIIFSNITIKDLFEFRLSLEVTACGLASERATEEDIKKLEDIVEIMKNHFEDVDKWAIEELDFHYTIARATKNPLFYSFISPISSLLIDSVFTKGRNQSDAKAAGIEGHAQIIKAIKNRDKKSAENAMIRHIERSRKVIIPEL